MEQPEMDDNRNIFAQTPVEPSQELIQPGDVALLLKKDGSCQALTFGYDRGRLLQPMESLSEDDKAMLEQGKKLFALAFACGHPKLMQLLIDVSSDPNVIDLETLRATVTRH